MILAVSGQVPATEVAAEARRLFGAMPRGAAAPDPALPAPAPAGRRVRVEMPAQQAQILLGGLAPSLDDSDHAAVKVLATVLGGGMAGRLFAELRDRRGLAYAASSYYDPVRGPGALVLYLGTAPENAARAEAALGEEVERIRREGVGADELRRAKGYLLGRYAMDRRTNERQAWYLAFYEIEGVGQDYPERYRKAVEAVTADDVRRAARPARSSSGRRERPAYSSRRARASSAARISSANMSAVSGQGGLFASTYWQSAWSHCTKNPWGPPKPPGRRSRMRTVSETTSHRNSRARLRVTSSPSRLWSPNGPGTSRYARQLRATTFGRSAFGESAKFCLT